MPLLFLIAIGCGAFTVGAATVDVTTDLHAQQKAQVMQTTNFQASAYTTKEDCLRAAAQQGVPASACQRS